MRDLKEVVSKRRSYFGTVLITCQSLTSNKAIIDVNKGDTGMKLMTSIVHKQAETPLSLHYVVTVSIEKSHTKGTWRIKK